VTAWHLAAAVLFVALVPCLLVAMRGRAADRLAGLEALGVIESLLFLVLARALRRDFLYDVPLALALLSFGGGLVFARFLERWQ
jgi:multicomponent Na+:H+ antiporter subunit F